MGAAAKQATFLLLPGKAPIFMQNPKNGRKQVFKRFIILKGNDLYEKIRYFCQNNFLLYLRMAEIRHLSFLCKIRISVGRLCMTRQ